MRRRFVIAGAVCVLLLAVMLLKPSGADGGICGRQLIDGWSASTGVEALGAAPVTVSAADDAPGATGAVGGERDLVLTKTSGTGAASLFPIESPPDPNILGWSNAAGANSDGSVTWDGDDSDASTLDPTGLGGIDYSAEGTSGSFRFTVSMWDITGVTAPLTLEIYSDGAAASTQTVTLPAPVSTPTTVEFPISSFTPLVGGGADFASVGAIILRFGPGSGSALDMAIEQVTGPCAPPEPPEPPEPPTPVTTPPPPEGTTGLTRGPVAGRPSSTG